MTGWTRDVFHLLGAAEADRAVGDECENGCGDTNGRPQIDETEYLQEAYEFGKCIYPA